MEIKELFAQITESNKKTGNENGKCMKNIFDLLYYGDLRPSEAMPKSTEYNEAVTETSKLSEEIVDYLQKVMPDQEALDLFRNYEAAESNVTDLEKKYVFELGFMLAYKIHHQIALDEFGTQEEI